MEAGLAVTIIVGLVVVVFVLALVVGHLVERNGSTRSADTDPAIAPDSPPISRAARSLPVLAAAPSRMVPRSATASPVAPPRTNAYGELEE